MTISFSEISDAELGTLASSSKHPGIREYLGEVAEDGQDGYDGQFVRHEGTLKLSGAFDTDDHDITFLHVTGDLEIDGLYRDRCNDGPTMVIVDGSVRCRNAIVAGFLEVGGNLEAREAVIGDYNDGGALILGDLVAKLFMPFDLGFEVRGQVSAEEHIHWLRSEQPPKVLAPRFYGTGEDGSTTLFSGESDDQAMLADLAAGRSIVR